MKSKEGSSCLAEELSFWSDGLVNDVSPASQFKYSFPEEVVNGSRLELGRIGDGSGTEDPTVSKLTALEGI
jgi:hypothetical protein